MKKILIVIFLMVTSTAFSQKNVYKSNDPAIEDYLFLDEVPYPAPTIKNIVKWLNESTMDWETGMNKFHLTYRGVDENGYVYHGTGKTLKDATYVIGKAPEGIIYISYEDFSQGNRTVLDELMNEIEKYYAETSESGGRTYRVKYENIGYTFIVKRSPNDEIVFIKKVKLTQNQ